MIGAAYQRATTAQSTPAFELLINYPYHKENPDVFVRSWTQILK